MDNTSKMWDELMEYHGVSEDALNLVTNINGYNEDTLRDVLYCVACEREFSFEEEEEEEEEEDEDEGEEIGMPEGWEPSRSVLIDGQWYCHVPVSMD